MQTYLERDVRKLAQVADLSVFYAFLKAAAARSGQMLNYSDLAFNEIALTCGFSDQSRMTVLVKRYLKRTPRELRRAARQGGAGAPRGVKPSGNGESAAQGEKS